MWHLQVTIGFFKWCILQGMVEYICKIIHNGVIGLTAKPRDPTGCVSGGQLSPTAWVNAIRKEDLHLAHDVLYLLTMILLSAYPQAQSIVPKVITANVIFYLVSTGSCVPLLSSNGLAPLADRQSAGGKQRLNGTEGWSGWHANQKLCLMYTTNQKLFLMYTADQNMCLMYTANQKLCLMYTTNQNLCLMYTEATLVVLVIWIKPLKLESLLIRWCIEILQIFACLHT